MNVSTTTMTTTVMFSDDGRKRYLLEKTWDADKPTLAIVMLAPSEAAGIELDSTTLLVLNNASRLGYGSVSIVNLVAVLNDFGLKEAEKDPENLKAIVDAAEKADAVVYAAGVGKAKNKRFMQLQEQVLTALGPMESKLYCLCDAKGNARMQHPLSPTIRTWHLSPLKISELVPDKTPAKEDLPQKKKPTGKASVSRKDTPKAKPQ